MSLSMAITESVSLALVPSVQRHSPPGITLTEQQRAPPSGQPLDRRHLEPEEASAWNQLHAPPFPWALGQSLDAAPHHP